VVATDLGWGGVGLKAIDLDDDFLPAPERIDE
jgi:hypothetical protein